MPWIKIEENTVAGGQKPRFSAHLFLVDRKEQNISQDEKDTADEDCKNLRTVMDEVPKKDIEVVQGDACINGRYLPAVKLHRGDTSICRLKCKKVELSKSC